MSKLINKLDEIPKIAENGVLLPPHQSVYTGGQDSYITIPDHQQQLYLGQEIHII